MYQNQLYIHPNGARHNITRRKSYSRNNEYKKRHRRTHSKAATMQRKYRRKFRQHISKSAATPSLPAIKYSTSQ